MMRLYFFAFYSFWMEKHFVFAFGVVCSIWVGWIFWLMISSLKIIDVIQNYDVDFLEYKVYVFYFFVSFSLMEV